MKTQFKVTYRHIAIMLASSLPVDGQDFSNKVSEYLDTIKAMPTEAKIALKSAYIFSRKVPREEREDMFQELILAILKVRTKDEPFAYAIARCDWRNWWQKFKTRQHYQAGSLNDIVLDSDKQEVELGELIVGECEFETKMCDRLDCQRIWNKLPETIKPIIQRRLLGFPLNRQERTALNHWTTRKGYQLLLA